jgi:hypothetical protein
MDEAPQSRYAHGTGPEPHSYRIPREPVIPPGDVRGAIPREHMTRIIRDLDVAPARQAVADREAGQ